MTAFGEGTYVEAEWESVENTVHAACQTGSVDIDLALISAKFVELREVDISREIQDTLI